MKLLIVDDSKVIRDRLQVLLGDLDHVSIVGHAENYNQALNLLSTTNPDIVILDINMPEKNGLDILLQIKTMKNPCKVMMVSNYSDNYYRNLCKKMGADFFFDKSTEFEKIPEALDTLAHI